MDNKIVLILLSIFIPPLAVYFKTKSFGTPVIINIVLCFVFFFPAILHALWVCLA